MSKQRDPLGKRALFSGQPGPNGAEAPKGAEKPPAKPSPAAPTHSRRVRGPLDVTVTCSGCDTTSTISAAELPFQHAPVVVWLPWRKQPLLMRCTKCNHVTWHAMSRG